jgi:hypothetical protein
MLPASIEPSALPAPTMVCKIDRVSEQLNAKGDKLKDEIHSLKTWALLLYFALAAGMYATLARAFGWI